ncbi:MAG: PstS family phosphate ABC transporter substrate-binding protein [Opitutales bacterium]
MIIRICILLLAFLALRVQAEAEELSIVVSDLLGEAMREPLEAYKETNGDSLEYEFLGTLPALEDMESGEIDLAVIAVPETREPPREQYALYPFAYSVAVVAVNNNNPITELTLRDLGGIYGEGEEKNIGNWGELGLSGWENRSVKPLVGRDEESISTELFKHTVIRTKRLKNSVAVLNRGEAEAMVASDAAAIVVLPAPSNNENLKTLMLAESNEDPAFGVTEENVYYGDYPVRLTFYIVFPEEKRERLQGVLRVLLSDEVVESLRENDLLGLPETVRSRFKHEFEIE